MGIEELPAAPTDRTETDLEWLARMAVWSRYSVDVASDEERQAVASRAVRTLCTTYWCENTLEQRLAKNELIVELLDMATVPKWMRKGVWVRVVGDGWSVVRGSLGKVVSLHPGGANVELEDGSSYSAPHEVFAQG